MSLTVNNIHSTVFTKEEQVNALIPEKNLETHKSDFTNGAIMETQFATIKAALRDNLKPWMKEFLKSLPVLPADNYSNARPLEAVINHMNLHIHSIDFDKRTLGGKAELSYKNLNPDTIQKLFLDVKDMEIMEVKVNDVLLSPDKWRVVNTDAYKPQALEIAIPLNQKCGKVSIEYKTSPSACGLFWRNPEMTEGKKHPMLFTQAETIDGASFFPSQHTPQVRLTYNLTINTGSPELMAVGSAVNNPDGLQPDGVYSMNMPYKIPSYLLGFAVGDFQYHPYKSEANKRVGLYAEACKLKLASEKFSKLPEFIEKAESIFGPYLWQAYTPVLLTLAYPFGAMEHACASFLGGDCIDRIYVLAHELAHSWSGNLVTNGVWEEFFFNEGLTSYVEYRICAACISEDYALMNLQTNQDYVRAAMKKFKESGDLEGMKLCANFQPKEFNSSYIPYGKGQLFFMMLEKAMGKEVFDRFLKDYMNVFAFKSICRERFVQFLKLWLKHNNICENFESFQQANKLEEWFTGTEIPDNAPTFQSAMLSHIREVADKAIQGENVSPQLQRFDGPMTRTFLNMVSGQITLENLKILDLQNSFSATENYIIMGAWAQLCATTGYLTEEIKKLIKRFVIERNSATYADDIVAQLVKTNEGKLLAQQILKEGDKLLDPLTKKKIENYLV